VVETPTASIASASSGSAESESREQTTRNLPVPISESPTIGRPLIESHPSRSTSNGFIRTSEAGKGQDALCWSIASEIAWRFRGTASLTRPV
jgi:hypothetical protein